jgi:cytochrome P450
MSLGTAPASEVPASDLLVLDAPDLVHSRRSSLRAVVAILVNPLTALPKEVFRHGVVVSRILGRTRVYIADPALIHQVLVRDADRLEKGPELRRVLGPALGNGLLVSEGATWRWQRQSMAPAFQHDKLRAFLPAMIAAAEETRDAWLAAGPGARIDIGRDLMRTTFKIIVDTMLSGPGQIDAARVETSLADFLGPTNWNFVLGILKAPAWMPYPGRRRAARASAYMRSAVAAMVGARRRAPGDGRADLVALILAATDPETGRAMSDAEITDNLLTFITAGHETTALGLGWTLRLLAGHPKVVARMLAEIEAVTAGGPLEPGHIERLVEVRQVFSEAMRLYPPAPMIIRSVAKAMVLGGERIPVGTMIAVPIYAVHRHVKLWDDPERFDPDRFAPSQTRGRHRYAYMPFGAGQRVCIGSTFAILEGVAILAVLIRALRIEREEPAMPAATMRVTLRPLKAAPIRVFPRAPRAEAVSEG